MSERRIREVVACVSLDGTWPKRIEHRNVGVVPVLPAIEELASTPCGTGTARVISGARSSAGIPRSVVENNQREKGDHHEQCTTDP